MFLTKANNFNLKKAKILVEERKVTTISVQYLMVAGCNFGPSSKALAASACFFHQIRKGLQDF